MFKCKRKDMTEIVKQGASVGGAQEIAYKTQPDLGRVAEERALSLSLDFLQGVESAWLADKATVLDTNHKVDLVIEIQGNCLGFQVKTSEEGARKHEDNAPYFADSAHGYPDVIIAGPQRSGWDVVFQLCEKAGLNYNERCHTALAFAHAYKGRVINKRVFARPGDLIALGLARPHPNGLAFGADPPPL